MKKTKKIKQWFNERVVLEGYNEWEQVYSRKKFNWYTGTFIHAYFEFEHFGFNCQFVLLGFGFYFRYNSLKSLKLFKKWSREAKKEMRELLDFDLKNKTATLKKSAKLKKVL